MPDSTLRRVAVVLAAVAVVVVLAASGVAGQRYAARDTTADPTGPSTTQRAVTPSVETPTGVSVPTPSVFPGGQIVFGSADRDAIFEVPHGWEWVIGYWGLEVSDTFRGLLPRAFDAARLDVHWCPKDDAEPRAYVGWGPRVTRFGTDPELATRRYLRSWDAGYRYDPYRPTYFPPRPGPVTTVRLDDGTIGWIGSITGAIHDDKCPTITSSEVTVLSFRNAAGNDPDTHLTIVVGYRDIGTDADVSQATILRILRTAQGLRQ